MLPKNKSFTSLNNLNGIGPLSGLPLNQLTNSLSSLHNLASMQQFGQQLNSLTLSNLNHLNDGPGLSSLNSNLILENLGLLGRSSDEREGCRSLICDNNGVIIGETTYRCMICNKINESIAETRQHYYEVHAGNLLGNANSPHSTLNSLADVANAGIGNSNHNSMAAAAAAAAAAIISNSNSHNDHHHSINNSSHNTGGHGTSNGHSIHNQSNNQNHNIANNNGASSRSQTPNHLNYVANHPMKISAFNQVNGAGSNNLKKDNNNNSSSLSANLNPLSPHSSLQALSVAQLSNSLQGALSNNSNGDLLSLAGGASLLQPRKMKMEQHQQQHNSSQQSTQLHSSNSAKKRKIGDVVNKILNRNLNVTGNASSLLTSSNGTMYNGRSNSLEVGSSIRSPTDDRTVDAVDDLVDDPVDDLDEEPEMEYDHWSQMLSNAGQLNALTKVKGLSESALLNTFGRGLGAQPPFDNQLDLVDNFSNGLLDQLFQAKSADSIMKEESPRSIPSDLKLKRGCTTASVGKPGFIACAVCGVTRYYSCVYRRYGHFTCQVCYRFFRTFFSKPNQYSCAKLGDCPLNVRVRCRACWIQACINTYTVDGDRKQILDVYKPIKAPHHNGSNTESSNSALHALSIGSEQQLTIADSIGNDKYSSNESMSLLQQLKAHDSSSVASLRYINSMNAANVNSLFHLGGVNLSSSANVRSNAGGRSSDILNDEEEEVDDDPTVEVDDDEEPLDDESAGSRASLVMDESIDEDRPEIGLGDSDLGHRQQASLDSSLMNGTGGRKRALNDESNESEMDSSPTGLFGNQGTITDANINTITSAIKTTTTGSNDTSEKSRLHLLAGRQQLQRLLCQDLDKPITAQDL